MRRTKASSPLPPEASTRASRAGRAARDARLSDAQLDALFAEVDAEIRPAKRGPWGTLGQELSSLPTRVRRRVSLLAVLSLCLCVSFLAPRPPASGAERAWLLLVGCALALPLLPLFAAAQRPWQRPSVSPGRAWAWICGSCLLAVALATRPEWLPPLSHAASPWDLPALREALPCLGFGLATALPVFALTKAMDRGTPYSTWLALAAAGLSGNLTLLVHCGDEHTSHLLLGHASVGPVLLLAALVARGTWAAVTRRRMERSPRG